MTNPKMLELPVLPLRGAVIFPGMVFHFDVARPRSIAALEQCMMTDQRLFLVAQKKEETEEPAPNQIYTVGTVVNVRQVMNLPGENVRVLVEGDCRAAVQEYLPEEKYLRASVQVHRGIVLQHVDFNQHFQCPPHHDRWHCCHRLWPARRSCGSGASSESPSPFAMSTVRPIGDRSR